MTSILCALKKIVVDLFSVHMEILFHGNKSEKNNYLYSKNLNWKLGPFFLKIQFTILRQKWPQFLIQIFTV